MAERLDEEYHISSTREGTDTTEQAGPAESALCYEKGRFPTRQLRREESERARKAVSQRLEGRHAAAPAPLSLSSHPTQRWFARPTNSRAHKHTPQGCVTKAARLAGWLALAISWSGLLVGWLLPSWRRRNWCQRDGAIVVLYAPGLQGRTGFLSVKWLLLGKRKCVLTLGCERVQILRLESRIATTNIIGPPCSGRGKAQSTSWDWQLCVK